MVKVEAKKEQEWVRLEAERVKLDAERAEAAEIRDLELEKLRLTDCINCKHNFGAK